MLQVFRWMVFAISLAVTMPAMATERLLDRSDLPLLAKGGYALFFRHAKTDGAKRDTLQVDLNDCSTQRPLSPEGKRQATAIGKALKAAGAEVVAGDLELASLDGGDLRL